jgi:hypothetical protein
MDNQSSTIAEKENIINKNSKKYRNIFWLLLFTFNVLSFIYVFVNHESDNFNVVSIVLVDLFSLIGNYIAVEIKNVKQRSISLLLYLAIVLLIYFYNPLGLVLLVVLFFLFVAFKREPSEQITVSELQIRKEELKKVE